MGANGVRSAPGVFVCWCGPAVGDEMGNYSNESDEVIT